jgi:ferredoxin--NADP+ reductase
MIDGTGMCGGCRVLVDNKSQFACVDGPEFDAHEVNFEVLVQRNRAYRNQEQQSLAEYRRKHESQVESREAEASGVCAVQGVKP